MKKSALILGSLFTFAAFAGEGNLFPLGNFTAAKKNLSGLVRCNGGNAKLFCEEYTWNNCGRLEIDRAYTNSSDKTVTYSATAWIGGDGKTVGLPIEGGSRYDFSLEIRGEVKKANLNIQVWNDNVWGKDSKTIKADINRIAVQKTWTLYKGSFVAPKGVKNAAIALSLWASTRYPPV
ncbi:MAG: carbohydrate binding domain-containing protein, partial [Kiritimatiellae bacterium]|nr:carbohydrate binding domain-containing protein [Kiritimatiellia bacterium]